MSCELFMWMYISIAWTIAVLIVEFVITFTITVDAVLPFAYIFMFVLIIINNYQLWLNSSDACLHFL